MLTPPPSLDFLSPRQLRVNQNTSGSLRVRSTAREEKRPEIDCWRMRGFSGNPDNSAYSSIFSRETDSASRPRRERAAMFFKDALNLHFSK